MKLSILIPSITERLQTMSIPDHPDIEVLILTDNRKRSIGKKRQALLDIAQGDYVMWKDDDDELIDGAIDDILLATKDNPDVITFQHEAWINGKKHIVDVSKDYEDEQLHDGIVKRKPLCSSVWRRDIALQGIFPDINYGEDRIWRDQLKPQTEIHIDKVLHKYIWDEKHTASSVIKRTTKKKTVLLSFSSMGRIVIKRQRYILKNYNQKILGLIDSVKDIGFETDFLIYSPDHELTEYKGVTIHKGYPPDCKTHNEVPYMFKPAMFRQAKALGYEQAIWCDSSIRLLRHPHLALGYAEANGITAWENIGHPLEKYINNTAIRSLKTTLSELNGVPQIMACVIVMNFGQTFTTEILNEWYDLHPTFCEDNTVREGFIAHRHDQAILSALIHKWKTGLLPYGSLCYPPHHKTGEYEVIFLNK